MRGHGDVKLLSTCVQVSRQFVQQCQITGLAFLGKVLEVHHQTLVVVAGQESRNLHRGSGPAHPDHQEFGDVDPLNAVEVVHQRKNFYAGVFRLQERHDFVVHRLDGLALDCVEELIGLRIDPLHIAIGRQHVQPFGIEQIDLRAYSRSEEKLAASQET